MGNGNNVVRLSPRRLPSGEVARRTPGSSRQEVVVLRRGVASVPQGEDLYTMVYPGAIVQITGYRNVGGACFPEVLGAFGKVRYANPHASVPPSALKQPVLVEIVREDSMLGAYAGTGDRYWCEEEDLTVIA